MASLWLTIILITLVKNAVALTDHLWSQTIFPHASISATSSRRVPSEHSYYCPETCTCEVVRSEFEINCSSKDLTHVPLNLDPSLSDLNLAQNHIFNLTSEVSLKALKKLNISHNNITKLDKIWISSLENLQILDLSKNFLSSNEIENTFHNPLLTCLNLSYNRLRDISVVMFHKANALLTLDLSHNEIKDITYEAFQNQVHLQVIDLSSNKLLEVKHEWFKNFKNLKVLNLKKNSLKFLRNVVFWPLNNLRILDLSENSIISIGLLSFKGLIKLESLNISSNNISHIQEGVFRSLEAIRIIDLSQNSFDNTDKIFYHLNKLDTLYMRGLSNFKTLTSFSLLGLKELKFLDFSSSQLLDVNLNAFSDTKNLRKLDLSNVMLSNIKMGTFKNLSKVETLKLNENPWKCDCYMYWILTWLGEHTSSHLLSSSETLCHTPPDLQGQILLDALDHSMVCTNASIPVYTNKTKFKVGSTAFLKCKVKGDPTPSLTWITPQKFIFRWIGPGNYTDRPISESIPTDQLYALSYDKISEREESQRFHLMSNGNLAIRNVGRGDGGFYSCIASNPLGSHSVSIRLTLDYSFLVNVKVVSVLVGVATSFGFLLLTLISVLIRMILKHFRVKCPCRKGSSSPRTQQIKKILESMEHYKKQQLDRLRDNYNVQVQRIKDNCMQQMERLRESYSSQAERLRDIRDYGTLQIDRIRENYYFQVQRVRDYSTSQIIRLRENYLYQRNRIRKFSAHHLYKLRENYKLQQQHLNKILENLNIESCRNVCQRTDSTVFESDITLENVLVPKICLQSFAKETCDSNDNSSQISAYFTPDEAVSEVSEHENDDHDSVENNLEIKLYSPKDVADTSIKIEHMKEEDIIDIPQCSNSSLQPDIVFCETKGNSSSSNETIV